MELAGESGDVGSEAGSQNNPSNRLQEDITNFQETFSNNLEVLRKREDMILQILEAQENALRRGVFNTSETDQLFYQLNDMLSPEKKQKVMTPRMDIDGVSSPTNASAQINADGEIRESQDSLVDNDRLTAQKSQMEEETKGQNQLIMIDTT